MTQINRRLPEIVPLLLYLPPFQSQALLPSKGPSNHKTNGAKYCTQKGPLKWICKD